MTPHWQPCEVGRELFDAYWREAEAVTAKGCYTLDPDQPLLTTWREWEKHRDNCDKCKVRHE